MRPYKTKIGHVHLKVRNLERSIDFYSTILGFKVVEKIDKRYAFLTGGDAHHELALQNVGLHAPEPDPYGVGLYHVAYEVPDQASFASAYKALTEAGIPVYSVNHLISWALYFSDPDGNGVEIYWDTRKESWGHREWQGHSVPLRREEIFEKLSE